MDINCEVCKKKIATLMEVKSVKSNIRIDIAICKKCDDALWEKAIKSRQKK